jgi:hypothetical protein
LKLAQWFWRRRFFCILVYFYIFAIISPWKWPMVIIWTNLNLLPLRMIWAMFGWNWPSGSGEEDFQNYSIYFYIFAIISP